MHLEISSLYGHLLVGLWVSVVKMRFLYVSGVVEHLLPTSIGHYILYLDFEPLVSFESCGYISELEERPSSAPFPTKGKGGICIQQALNK